MEQVERLIANGSDKSREFLKCLKKKPSASVLMEPKIQAKSKFDPRHHNTVISEKQLLAKKFKKEHKAAIKELRKDSQFIAKVKFDEQMEKFAHFLFSIFYKKKTKI